MERARSKHTSGIITDSITNIEYLVIVGGWNEDDLDSVEMLELPAQACQNCQSSFIVGKIF